MENENKNIFPKMRLFDPLETIKGIGRFLIGAPEVHLYSSNHYIKEHFEPTDGRGAASMLDNHLYDSIPIPGETADGEAMEAYQPQLPFDKDEAVKHYVQMAKDARVGFDSEGNYFDGGLAG